MPFLDEVHIMTSSCLHTPSVKPLKEGLQEMMLGMVHIYPNKIFFAQNFKPNIQFSGIKTGKQNHI